MLRCLPIQSLYIQLAGQRLVHDRAACRQNGGTFVPLVTEGRRTALQAIWVGNIKTKYDLFHIGGHT